MYVVLAGLICVAACSAAHWLDRQNQQEGGELGWLWIGFQSLAAGAGVWAANVLAMLGFHADVPVRMSPWMAGLALAVAVVGAAPSYFARRRLSRPPHSAVIAALSTSSFAAVHFVTLAGLRAPGRLHYQLSYQVVAVLAAFGLCLLAGTLARRKAAPLGKTAAPALIVLAIGSLHFISLAGVRFAPMPGSQVHAVSGSNAAAAAVVAMVSVLLLGASAAASLMAGVGEHTALRRLRTATNAMPSALALFDRDDRLVVWNTTFELVMGPKRNLVRVGMPFSDLVEAMPARQAAGAHPEGPARRERSHVEFPIPGEQWIRVDNVPTEDGGLLSLGTNITEMRRSQAALAEALDRAEAASRAKSEFLATMSHEIRTPLNGVLGMAQAMGNDELNPVQHERLDVIRGAGEALLSLLNDVLDISKIEANRIELEDGAVDLEAIGSEVVATFSALAAEKDVCVTLDVADPARGCWRGDPGRVRQVLQNLVSNAVKFTDRGAVHLEVGHDGNQLIMRVADTGPGIPIEQQAHVFETFAQADASTTRRYGGSGLGLSICRALVRMMGGEILLDSLPGQGATFTVRLPLPPTERPASEAAPAPAPEAGRLRILAAEDNPMNQLVLRTLLAQAGLDVELVANGEEAVRAWEGGGWDVILMDVQMPVMDGPTAARAIRERERRSGASRTPIVALTANAMSHHVKEYQAAGMDILVAKPIKLGELFAALRTVCSAGEHEGPEAAVG